MAERVAVQQNFEYVDASKIYSKVADLKAEGYRIVQMCALNANNAYEVIYSFDKDHVLYNYKVAVNDGEELESISNIYMSAFIYENEILDLFGIQFNDGILDDQGKFV